MSELRLYWPYEPHVSILDVLEAASGKEGPVGIDPVVLTNQAVQRITSGTAAPQFFFSLSIIG